MMVMSETPGAAERKMTADAIEATLPGAAHWIRQVDTLVAGFEWLRTVTHEAGVVHGYHTGSMDTCENRGCVYARRVLASCGTMYSTHQDTTTKGQVRCE